jgi:hypothetical protein
MTQAEGEGAQRHIVTDAPGLILYRPHHAAQHIQDRDGAVEISSRPYRHRFPWLRHLFADGAYAGREAVQSTTRLGQWILDFVKRSGAAKSFVVLPIDASTVC